MTSTVVSPTAPSVSLPSQLRLLVALVAIVACSIAAFAIGRATGPTHTRTVTPVPAAAPAATPIAGRCLVGHAC